MSKNNRHPGRNSMAVELRLQLYVLVLMPVSVSIASSSQKMVAWYILW